MGTEAEIVQSGGWEGAMGMFCNQGRQHGVVAHHLCCGPNPGDPLLVISFKKNYSKLQEFLQIKCCDLNKKHNKHCVNR